MRRLHLVRAVALSVAVLAPPRALAQTITARTESEPYPGVRVIDGQTSGPTTRFRAALIALCTDYVHVAATRAPSGLQRTSTWASAAGVSLAVNGDFFTAEPRVYGQAVGGGVLWPARATGTDPAVSGEWYYRRFGWIAFGPGWVEFSHTEYVKERAAAMGVTQGWMPSAVTATVPRGTQALVSGFPELVTEGRTVTCASPTASSCFSDRSDMRARNPRTAMGLTRDRRTFILVTVDGRSSVSAGMYGTELARLMELLGAWQAFNLDGGGSTTMWLRGRGVLNVPSDASGERAVANHWGIFAGSASGRPRAAGSCQALTSDAGVVDAGLRDASVVDAGGRDAARGDGAAIDGGGILTDSAVDAGATDDVPELLDSARGEMPPVTEDADERTDASERTDAPTRDDAPRGDGGADGASPPPGCACSTPGSRRSDRARSSATLALLVGLCALARRRAPS
jgi:hypothetical protein